MQIVEKDIVFVTTALHTKWLHYHSDIIARLFPGSRHVVVDGRQHWPNAWFYWIDEVKKCNEKYYVHLDEDFFITDREELLKVVRMMESKEIDLIGCSDGYGHFRHGNPVAINTFLMCGRVGDIKRLVEDLKGIKFQLARNNKSSACWENDRGIRFKEAYKSNVSYPHRKFGGSDFTSEFEPYYVFLWSMKELGCKFDYLYPHLDKRFNSTNPRLDEFSGDIGIHMWYLRRWNSDLDVLGMPNRERYARVEELILQGGV